MSLAGLLLVMAPQSAGAAITTFGSSLSAPATLNTAESLGYYGTYTDVPPSPGAPNGVLRTAHYGADTALWNAGLAGGAARVPAQGQALKVSLEGCAEAAAGGPWPLTQIHFQDLSPLPGGGAKINITSAGFDIPVCGQNGASGSTVTTYEPFNLCVAQGDYVAFDDEGGFVENFYPAGVPYQVIGVARGSTMDSFIRNGGIDNGAMLPAGETSANDGFAANGNEELMMQVTLGTGADARYVCPGGSKEAPPVLSPIAVHPQTDGINHERIVAVAVYCRLTPECRGTATMTLASRSTVGGASKTVGHSGFSLPGNKTTHVPIRLAASVMTLIRKHHGISMTLTAVVDGQTFVQAVTVKIL